MHELIYSGKDVADKIKTRFPSAKITDASDDIHTERFELDGDISEDDFYVFALKEGFIQECLAFGIMLHSRSYKEKIAQWLKRAKEEVSNG